jgi:transcription factor C subunit 7
MVTAPHILNPFSLPLQVHPPSIQSNQGVRADPALAAHGITQTKQLTKHILSLPHKPQKIYCSPYYRCIQTIVPLAKELQLPIYLDEGIGEWYGLLHHSQSPDHPTPLDVDQWPKFFPDVDFRRGETGIIGDRRGETLKTIHERVQQALEVIIRQADMEGLHTILLCTHAATNIALGRALTGDPDVFPSYIDL